MPIIFSCTCGKAFRAQESAAGKRVKCPKCGKVVAVPEPKRKDEPAGEGRAQPRPARPEREHRPNPPSAGSGTPPPYKFSPDSDEPRRAKQEAPAFDELAKQRARQRYQHLVPENPSTNLLDYGYGLLLLTFIPLGVGLLQPNKEDTVERLLRSFEKSSPPPERQASPKGKLAPRPVREAPVADEGPNLPDGNIDELIARLPGGRVEGAFLPRQTFGHWLFALLAGGVFFGLACVLFPSEAQPIHLLVIGVFTATIGILLLLLAQLLAEWTQGYIFVSRNIIVMFLFWIAWAIGFSYRAALDPDMGLIPSFLGFTFGVGFCEEVCKALPLLWHYRAKGALPWRVACAWGFASGVGFGVSEGITYSADLYNGIATGDVYLVRFVSCVALHGIWSASAALFIHKFQYIIQAEFAWQEYIPRALFLVSIPMILHGLYDTFLKKDMDTLALVTALVSFAWLAWSIERTRSREESAKIELRHA